MRGWSGYVRRTETSSSVIPAGSMFQPIAVYGPGCGTNSTSSTPIHGLWLDAPWPSFSARSPSPAKWRTLVVE